MCNPNDEVSLETGSPSQFSIYVVTNCREAGESILTFLSRLFEQATLERCSKESAQQLLSILAPKGPGLYRLLLGGAAGAVPPSRLSYISEAMVNILKVLPLSSLLSSCKLDHACLDTST